jgi:hypothetical protein
VLLSRELNIGKYICSSGLLSHAVTFFNLQSSTASPGFFIEALQTGIYSSTPGFLHSRYLLNLQQQFAGHRFLSPELYVGNFCNSYVRSGLLARELKVKLSLYLTN